MIIATTQKCTINAPGSLQKFWDYITDLLSKIGINITAGVSGDKQVERLYTDFIKENFQKNANQAEEQVL